MPNKNIRLQASLHINSQMAEFRNRGYRAAELTIRNVTMNAKKYAEENVEPGHGPSPHPHRWPYVDTRNLQRSIGIKIEFNGVRLDSVVYTDLDYGTYLEVGWRARNGRFYRYPWLKPAWKKAMGEYKRLAARSFKDAVMNLPGGINLEGTDLDVAKDHYEHMATITKKWAEAEKAGVISRDEATRMINFGIDPDVHGYSTVKLEHADVAALISARKLNRKLANAAPKVRRHDARRDNQQEAQARQTRGNVKYTPGKARPKLDSLLSQYEQSATQRRSAKDNTRLTEKGLVSKETLDLQKRLIRAKKRKGKK